LRVSIRRREQEPQGASTNVRTRPCERFFRGATAVGVIHPRDWFVSISFFRLLPMAVTALIGTLLLLIFARRENAKDVRPHFRRHTAHQFVTRHWMRLTAVRAAGLRSSRKGMGPGGAVDLPSFHSAAGGSRATFRCVRLAGVTAAVAIGIRAGVAFATCRGSCRSMQILQNRKPTNIKNKISCFWSAFETFDSCRASARRVPRLSRLL